MQFLTVFENRSPRKYKTNVKQKFVNLSVFSATVFCGFPQFFKKNEAILLELSELPVLVKRFSKVKKFVVL